ncbi:MAG: hypothetical protein GX115_00305 [Ruminiclostridium sp.]|nr:hypothetical protein [Ruminiclostridium sp.]
METMYKGNINGPTTMLTSTISATATSITVQNGSVLPDAPNIAVIGSGNAAETIVYGAKSGNTLNLVTRGFEGSPLPWPANTEVVRRFTAYDYNALVDNIQMLKAQIDNINTGTNKTSDILSFANDVKNNVSLLMSQTQVNLTVPLFSNMVIPFGNKYYVNSQQGNNNADGLTPGTAKRTITAAIALAQDNHHDIIFIKGGTYTEAVNLNKSTTWLVGYDGDVLINGINRRVVNANGTVIPKNNRTPNISVNAPYCILMNLDSVNSPYLGIDLGPQCNYSMIINCTAIDGADVGMICSDIFGSPTGEAASFNQLIGCTSAYNYDFDSMLIGDPPGAHADGFENEGIKNHYIKCTAYANSDDGFDMYRANMSNLYQCTAFYSGRAELAYQGSRNRAAEKALVGNPVVQGDAMNFKMGPGNGVRTDTVVDGGADCKAIGCLSAYARLMGYTNNQALKMVLVHCTGIGNLNRNFFSDVSPYGEEEILAQNCLSYAGGRTDTLYGNSIQNTNSWNLGVTVSASDFVSLDPNSPSFGVLAANSPLRNRNDLVNDGYNLAGNNDLGWSEVLDVMPKITYQA